MSKKKILMYNGGKDSYRECSDPDLLVKGKFYEIVAKKDLGFQTNYLLNGLAGEYNSVWFSEPTSCFAYSNTIPVEGKSMEHIIRFTGINVEKIIHTSPVRCVEQIASDSYKVYTQNTLYIVKVINKES